VPENRPDRELKAKLEVDRWAETTTADPVAGLRFAPISTGLVDGMTSNKRRRFPRSGSVGP
jgi:hypothetical protein